MKITSLLLKFASIIMLLNFLGCAGSDDTPETDDSASLDEQADEAARSPLYIAVKTRWADDDSSAVTTRGYCYIDPDNLAANDIACTVTIPEGDLHFSKLLLTVGTGDATTCRVMFFTPYYRRIGDATDATFTPPFGTSDDEVDCTDPDEKGCYAGPAKDLFSTFPNFTTFWWPSSTTASNSYTLKSPWEADDSMGNTYLTNNLTVRNADYEYGGVGGPVFYESAGGNVFRDYTASCTDAWHGRLYRITMTIEDEDTAIADTDLVNDEWFDWNP